MGFINTIDRTESTIAFISGEEKTANLLELLKRCLISSGATIISENICINTSKTHCISEVTFAYKNTHDNLVIVADEITQNLSEETLNSFEEVMIPSNYKNNQYQNINSKVIKYSTNDNSADVVATDIISNEDKTTFKMLSKEIATDMIVNSNTILPMESLLALVYAMVKIGVDANSIIKLLSE